MAFHRRKSQSDVCFRLKAVSCEEIRHFLDGQQLSHRTAAEIRGDSRVFDFSQPRYSAVPSLFPLGFFEILQRHCLLKESLDRVERNPGVLR